MTTNRSSQDRPKGSPQGGRADQPVQTGALSGGQPGQGVDTSPSPPGQSNVDAAARQGVEYGRKDLPKR